MGNERSRLRNLRSLQTIADNFESPNNRRTNQIYRQQVEAPAELNDGTGAALSKNVWQVEQQEVGNFRNPESNENQLDQIPEELDSEFVTEENIGIGNGTAMTTEHVSYKQVFSEKVVSESEGKTETTGIISIERTEEEAEAAQGEEGSGKAPKPPKVVKADFAVTSNTFHWIQEAREAAIQTAKDTKDSSKYDRIKRRHTYQNKQNGTPTTFRRMMTTFPPEAPRYDLPDPPILSRRNSEGSYGSGKSFERSGSYNISGHEESVAEEEAESFNPRFLPAWASHPLTDFLGSQLSDG